MVIVALAALRKCSGTGAGQGVTPLGTTVLPVPTNTAATRAFALPGPDSRVRVNSCTTHPTRERSTTELGGVRICSAIVKGGRLMHATAGSDGCDTYFQPVPA